MLKALIFDMDGVLIDSMLYHADAWKAVLGEEGIDVTRQDIYDVEGSNHEGLITAMFEKVGRTPDPRQLDELAQKKRTVFGRISHLKAFQGITQCLHLLKDRYQLAVVSGSDRVVVEGIIKGFFPGLFDVIISGEDVDKGKPAPEPYLKAVEMLGVDKDECIVVENAPLGVEAAKEAGLYCVAVPTHVEPSRLKRADVVLKDHDALMEYLGRLV